MTGTPNSERLHIVLAGECNSGKSSLLNALVGQAVSIVSDVPGTTTDCVRKAVELPGVGPCVLVDTAGYGDSSILGGQRIGRTRDALKEADIVLLVIDSAGGSLPDFQRTDSPVIPVLNKKDAVSPAGIEELSALASAKYGKDAVAVDASSGDGIDALLAAIIESVPEDWDTPLLTVGLAGKGDTVVLVIPQDSEAPKGRLILPQQQTIRELLDRGCKVVCCNPEDFRDTLEGLKQSPVAVIADSQVLSSIKDSVPCGTRLTSFSILLAAAKGDMDYFLQGARAIDSLNSGSRVLVAEACSHVPASEDIGRVKIPRLLRSIAGEGLSVDFVSGKDFPDDLRAYDLVIHCGACMFNRRYVLSRVAQARSQGVPMTNYGVTIAYIHKLL